MWTYITIPGHGRFYVDGQVTAATVSGDSLTTGFPFVASDGFTEGSSIGLNFPTGWGGGNATVVVDSAFRNTGNVVSRGMLQTTTSAPRRLLTVGAVKSGDKWHASSVATLVSNLQAQASHYVEVDVDAGTVGIYQRSPRVLVANVPFGQAWLNDSVNKEIVFQPQPGMFDAANYHLGYLFVNFVGPSAPVYSLRVVLPSVSSLEAAGGPLSILSASPIILTGNFNTVSPVAAMVVTPELRLAHPTPSTASIYRAVGVFITDSQTDNPVRFVGTGSAPDLEIDGSFVNWCRTGTESGPPVRLKLRANIKYLDGTLVPPMTPSVTDLQVLTEGFWTYKAFAVTPAGGTPTN